jgi:hypothetical protein
MIKKTFYFLLSLTFIFSISFKVMAGAELSGGVWWVYQNGDNDGLGEFAEPALVIYADDDGSHGPWGFSSEMRFGKGSFSNPETNNSGDRLTMHKAWISYTLSETDKIFIGKSQVPFGWKTSNFWPGDLLQGGYGDQMDVGLKLSGKRSIFSYDAALYLQDDWGSTSTDSSDDNGHWGSAVKEKETYRKGPTAVANLDWSPMNNHTLGISFQTGKLRDLKEFKTTKIVSDDGDHQAVDLHYYFQQDNITAKYRYIDMSRDFRKLETCITATVISERCPNLEVSSQRNALHISYAKDKWNYYIEATSASTDTIGNTSNTVYAFAPGMTYDYGPGWVYLEYLWQDGSIDSFGDVSEGDFKSLYVSFDFYF